MRGIHCNASAARAGLPLCAGLLLLAAGVRRGIWRCRRPGHRVAESTQGI